MKTLFTLLLLFISTVGFSQCGIFSPAELTYDFGKINFTGDTLVANFWFKNPGKGDLQIFSAKPSCGCTVASFPEITAAGTGGVIVVKYFSASPGFINKSVTIQTNDPNNGIVILRIKGETVKE